MSEICYLAKIGELNLKKGNLKNFEKLLSDNLKKALKGCKASVSVRAGRMYVYANEADRLIFESALNKLTGITGWAEASITEKNIDLITASVLDKAHKAAELGYKTFKIETRRADKNFPMTSYEVSNKVGGEVHSKGILKTDVHNPDTIFSIEIREKVFIYGLEHKGQRGLPCGCSGKGVLLLSGGIDSPVAGWRMISRGMKLDFLYFDSPPYTSEEAKNKVETLAKLLSEYGLGGNLHIIPFAAIQKRILEAAPEPYRTLMMRICMMKIACMTADAVKAQCIVTGESLGQVASQTVENLSITNSHSYYPVFRPLIGMDKEEIITKAKEIGSYGTSILPYEDCCILFSPKHPVLHTKAENANYIFSHMEIEPLLTNAFNGRIIKHAEQL